MIVYLLTLCGAVTLSAWPDHDTPEEIISKARTIVSLNATGPVEIQANLRIASPTGEMKGTYILDWAAPDRFRREIHLPGYDEISVVNGSVMYRKRNTNFTPLAAFRVEELMDPATDMTQLQRDSAHPAEQLLANLELLSGNPAASFGPTILKYPAGAINCVQIPSVSYELLCTDRKHGWPISIAGRKTADDETIRYANYRKVGFGFLPFDRLYFVDGRFFISAEVTSAQSIKTVSPETFAVPSGAEQLDWCADQTPAQLVPLTGPLPVDPQSFQNSEIVDAFVNADGTPRRLEIIGTGGPAADAALQEIANLIRFVPAACGNHPVSSELPVVIGGLDIATAAFQGETRIQSAGKGGYTKPDCLKCWSPSYSDEAFYEKIQGTIILSTLITTAGQANDIYVLKGLGHGLDQQAREAVRHWQFKSALGPDGKPAAVRMLIEVDFHLY